MTIDAGFFASVDPSTLLFTGVTTEDPLAGATELFLGNEFGEPDVNKFATLAAASHPVESLDGATHNERGISARYATSWHRSASVTSCAPRSASAAPPGA